MKDTINEIPKSRFIDSATEKKFKTFLDFIEPFKNNLEMLRIITGLHLVQKMNPDYEKKIIEIFLADNTNIELDKISKGWKLLEKLK